MITSNNNAQVKRVMQLAKKSKLRREEGVFLVEGPRMFYEAPSERVEKAYLSESFYEHMEDKAVLSEIEWEVVKEDVFTKMSQTMTPQGVLCIVRQPRYVLADLMRKEHPLLLLLENLQDPGNMGTIFRTAEGAGVDGILLSKGCVDIYNPKTVRATMGSVYRMPLICLEEEAAAVLERLQQQGIRGCAAHLKGEHTYDGEDYRRGTIFLIGNEGNGLTEELSEAAELKVRIPMEGKLESLNAGVAAAILMYEAHRQRQ